MQIYKLITKVKDIFSSHFIVIKKSNAIRIFCECSDGKHTWCCDPDLLFAALDDAKKEMSYSNWHSDKFNRIEDCLRQFYREHNIPLKFYGSNFEESRDIKAQEEESK